MRQAGIREVGVPPEATPGFRDAEPDGVVPGHAFNSNARHGTRGDPSDETNPLSLERPTTAPLPAADDPGSPVRVGPIGSAGHGGDN